MKCPNLSLSEYDGKFYLCYRDTLIGITSFRVPSEELGKYILEAVNSHWDLTEYKEYVHARIEDGREIMTYPEWLNRVKELQQALEEAEKE